MSNKIKQKIFIILFALLYISVALVSTYHAISFFGLANVSWIALMLAITFEIGQAAVLFSILTNNSGKTKIMPWILMCVLTLVQVLGNVYSSYKYLITNSAEFLRFFKEPIFIWMDLPDMQCNVILTYIIGAILPIVSLLMTGMVTNYLNDKPDNEYSEDNTNVEKTNIEQSKSEDIDDVQDNEIKEDTTITHETIVNNGETEQEHILEPEQVNEQINEQIIEEPEQVDEETQVEQPEVSQKSPSHFINL